MSGVRIELERSGGIAGVAIRRSLDTASLPADGRAEVESAIAGVDLEALAVAPAGETAGADRFHYSLEVESGGRRHRVALSEPDVPAALRPVIELVMSQGRRLD